MKSYKKQTVSFFLFIFILLSSQTTFCKNDARQEVKIPDILGYRLLKCDFHIHTVFSDGDVWPSVRSEEAWQQGLDAFALTDHIEYTPHKDDIKIDYNRPYDIALGGTVSRGLTLIKGAEITRNMPPGHLNAIFLKDVAPLKTEKWKDAVQIAHDQGAFIFWNHPGWKAQQPDGIAKWYNEHEELLKNKCLNGIEVINGREYSPEAFKWCLEKNITMLANSDIHTPMNSKFDPIKGEHRPLTLVLAKENTEEAIKDALFNARTVVYYENTLIGKLEYLLPIFENSITIKNPDVVLSGKKRVNIQIYNSSEINYELNLDKKNKNVAAPEKITLYADRTVMLWIHAKLKDDLEKTDSEKENKTADETESEEQKSLSGKKTIELNYKVTNLLIAPNESLPVKIKITADFQK